MLFDGRDRAQNGWFVLRSLIPTGKTTGAIVWHIRPDVIPNWTRPPMIAHSQVGYAPGFSKVAILELDPKYNGPRTAKVLRLTEDGSYKQVFESPITPSTPWLRYVYSKFDFTPVKDPGLYVIEYADQRTAPFPISKTLTRTSGRTAWTIISPSKWTMSPFAKATACGTALRTSTMAAWHPSLASSSTVGIRTQRPTGSSKAATTFPE
jgi:hypothetical protein